MIITKNITFSAIGYKFYILVITSSLILLSGCTSKDTRLLINDYASSSKTTQENIMRTYEDAIYQEQQYLYYKAVRDGASIKELFPKPIEYSGQRKALKDLVEFTDALVLISSDKSDANVDNNSKKLHNSLSKLSKNEYVTSHVEVSSKDVELLGTIVNAGTKGYIEYYNTDKLKEIIVHSKQWVEVILNELDKDLNSWKRHLKKTLNSRKNIELLILNDAHKYCTIKTPNKECHVLSESLKSKVALYEEVHNIQVRIDNLDKEFQALKESIELLQKLHLEIIESMKKDEIDILSKESLERNINRLQELSDSVNNYRKSTEG